jgi:hypothetical protein
VSLVEFALDHWRLRHPGLSSKELRKLRLPAMVLLFVSLPLLVILLS